MLFQEAFEALKNGKYVQRTEWKAEQKYVCLMPGMHSLWMIMTIPNPNAGNWLPLVRDLEATDWEVIDKLEAPKVEEDQAA